MEKNGILPEIFYKILLNTDSFIQMRDLIIQLTPSYKISENILKRLSEKFNIDYKGDGKSEFIKKIKGMTNLVNFMKKLNSSDITENIARSTISDLPIWYFLAKNDDYMSPYVIQYKNINQIKYLIDRISVLGIKSQELINTIPSILKSELEMLEILKYFVENGFSCQVVNYDAKNLIQNQSELNNILNLAKEKCYIESNI